MVPLIVFGFFAAGILVLARVGAHRKARREGRAVGRWELYLSGDGDSGGDGGDGGGD